MGSGHWGREETQWLKKLISISRCAVLLCTLSAIELIGTFFCFFLSPSSPAVQGLKEADTTSHSGMPANHVCDNRGGGGSDWHRETLQAPLILGRTLATIVTPPSQSCHLPVPQTSDENVWIMQLSSMSMSFFTIMRVWNAEGLD